MSWGVVCVQLVWRYLVRLVSPEHYPYSSMETIIVVVTMRACHCSINNETLHGAQLSKIDTCAMVEDSVIRVDVGHSGATGQFDL